MLKASLGKEISSKTPSIEIDNSHSPVSNRIWPLSPVERMARISKKNEGVDEGWGDSID